MAASNIFGRGIGKRKIMPVMEAYPDILTMSRSNDDKIIVLKDGEVLAQGITNDILNNKELLNQSNLELLPPLKLLHKLEENNIHNEKVKEILWQLSLGK